MDMKKGIKAGKKNEKAAEGAITVYPLCVSKILNCSEGKTILRNLSTLPNFEAYEILEDLEFLLKNHDDKNERLKIIVRYIKNRGGEFLEDEDIENLKIIIK